MSAISDFFGDSDSEKVLLIEVNAYITGTGETTFYLSSAPHITEPTDTPPNQIYDNKLTGHPYFTRRIPEVFYGKSTAGFGDLIIDNSEGDLDDWLDYGWDGRDITIKIGDATWTHARYVTLLQGKVQRLIVDSDTQLKLEIRDRLQLLDAPVQNNLLASPAPTAGEPIPLCYGVCYNIKPVLVNPSTLTYQVHDGEIVSIDAVYDNGVSVAFTWWPATGKFILSAAPVGDITADVRGAVGLGYASYYKAGNIIYDLLTRSGGVALPSSIVLGGGSYLLNLDIDRPYKLGLYITDRQNLIDVLDDIIHSVGGWYGFNREGYFVAQVLSEPSSDPPATTDGVLTQLTSLDVIGNISIQFLDTPIYKMTLGHTKNWYIQKSDALAGAVTLEQRAWLEAEYRVVVSEDATVKTKHLYAAAPEQINTLITDATDAQTESDRVLDFYKSQRFNVKLSTFTKPFNLTVGDNVKLTDERFGFSDGVYCRVIGLTEYFIDNQIELELFR